MLQNAQSFIIVARPFAQHPSKADDPSGENDCLGLQLTLLHESKCQLVASERRARPYRICNASGEALNGIVIRICRLAPKKGKRNGVTLDQRSFGGMVVRHPLYPFVPGYGFDHPARERGANRSCSDIKVSAKVPEVSHNRNCFVDMCPNMLLEPSTNALVRGK